MKTFLKETLYIITQWFQAIRDGKYSTLSLFKIMKKRTVIQCIDDSSDNECLRTVVGSSCSCADLNC